MLNWLLTEQLILLEKSNPKINSGFFTFNLSEIEVKEYSAHIKHETLRSGASENTETLS